MSTSISSTSEDPGGPQGQRNEDVKLRRFIAYSVFALYAVSLSGGIIICILVQSPWPLVITNSPVLLCHHIIRSLFPVKRA